MTLTPTMDDILQAVERATGVGVRDLRGPAGFAPVRSARMLAYFVANQCFNIPVPAIARALKRNNWTVKAGIDRALESTRFDPELVDRVEESAEGIARARCEGRHSNPIYATAGA